MTITTRYAQEKRGQKLHIVPVISGDYNMADTALCGKHVCDTETEHYSDAPDCPLCGRPTDYWEGTYDQDFMGNDIEGWNHVCYGCHLGTDIIEFDRRGNL